MPNMIAADDQQQCVRRQLRVLAVMCTCHAPFMAWSRLCVESRSERVSSVRSEIAQVLRNMQVLHDSMDFMICRVRKQDVVLHKLGQRRQLRIALSQWVGAMSRRGRSYQCLTTLRREWFQRWQQVHNQRQEHGWLPASAARKWCIVFAWAMWRTHFGSMHRLTKQLMVCAFCLNLNVQLELFSEANWLPFLCCSSADVRDRFKCGAIDGFAFGASPTWLTRAAGVYTCGG